MGGAGQNICQGKEFAPIRATFLFRQQDRTFLRWPHRRRGCVSAAPARAPAIALPRAAYPPRHTVRHPPVSGTAGPLSRGTCATTCASDGRECLGQPRRPRKGGRRAAGRADARSWWAKAGGWLRHRSPVAARHARRPGARRAVRRATGRAASLKRCRAYLPPMAAPPADRCRTPCMHVRLVRPGIRGRGRGQVYEPILPELPPRVCCLFLSRPWPCCSVWRAPCQMRPSANGCMGR